MRIAIAIATTGRPQTVAECVRRVARQSRPADAVHVCGAAQEDIASLTAAPGLHLIVARKGSSSQRNALIDAIGGGADVILFMDDDFVLHERYLEHLDTLFSEDAGLVGTNGEPLADGINLPAGYTFAQADELVSAGEAPGLASARRKWIKSVYGCNFAVRQSAVLEHEVRFDERLPLYGWQEDIDFSSQLSRHGRILRTNALAGVHLGVKSGRVSGVRFGYSQVANPVYLGRKGTMGWPYALKLISKNLAANVWGSLAASKLVDRRGRLRGNVMALQDVLFRHKVSPERILEL
jgi:GT2 family glycosyltransferase